MRATAASFLLALALAAGASFATPVRLDVSPSEPPKRGTASPKVVLRLEEVDSGARAPRVIEREVKAPASVSLELPAGAAWRLAVEGEDVWSPPQSLSADRVNGGATLSVVLYPAGRIHGRLAPAAREKSPALGEIDLRLAEAPGLPGAPRFPETVVRCPVAGGELRCLVPAGRLDLRLKAAGFVPIYLWGVAVERGRARELGTLALKRGSSLVGRVQTEGGASPGPACTIRLAPRQSGELPQNASAEDVAADRRLRGLARETHPNDRGFFVFEDLPPGVYSVTATAPDLAPAGVLAVEVREGLEAEIREPLTLDRPVAFEVVLDPPLDPYGQPWRLELSPRDSTLGGAARWHKGVAASDGRWIEKGVAAGRYRLKVLGEGETRWAEEEVEARDGQPPLFLSVPVVEVRGTVDRGGEPLAATLWFGGRNGRRRIRFDSDDKGRFEGALSSEGKWPVEMVYPDDATVRVALAPVEVKRPPGKRFASLALHVPNTLVRGEVVDEAGNPLPEAQVSVHQGVEVHSAATSDGAGKFTLRGLPPGPFSVEAVRGERTSGWVNAAVADDGESPRLRLVARRQVEYRGHVVSARGPVAGAQILAFPQLDEVAPFAVATVAEAVTDPEGAFALRLPSGARSLNLLAFPPGFAFRMMRLPADPERPLAISVNANGGNLLLPSQGGLLAHGGTFVPTELIKLWLSPEDQDGRALRVPNVEAGDYTFCWAEAVAASDALRRGATPPAEHCATGTVQPFADLNLVPRSPAPKP